MSFTKLGLHPALASACESLGYLEPTPIQQQAIPVILSGSDLVGCAETGTGKTAAFLLPLLQKISAKPRAGVRALILAPTRELAAQIAANLQALDPKKRVRAALLVGGANLNKQVQSLSRSTPVVIATPGRLFDHLERGSLNLAQIETLIIDEADRMLDMGFWPDIRRVLAVVPAERQTLLFSATMPPAVEKAARAATNNPQLVEVSPRGQAAAMVEQMAYPVAAESKTALLLHLLERERFERVLVFTRTRRGAERLSHILQARKHQVNRIHADRTQPQRDAALRGFKDGKHRVLVATDIAARGIDVEAISHVINYDVPEAAEDYIHRIGRTGRAGLSGQAITLVTPVDELYLREIERLTGQAVKRVVLPGFGGAAPIAAAKPFKVFGSGHSSRSYQPRRVSR